MKIQAILESTKESKLPISFHKEPASAIYTLHRRHGQSLRGHFFIRFLSVFRACKSFIWTGARFQIFASRLPIDAYHFLNYGYCFQQR